MENQKPEALALARIFEIRIKMFGEHLDNPPASRAAKELRRQHARIQELEAMLESIGAGGVSAQRVTQGKGHIAQDSKMVAAQEPFGYFKAESFGWRDCAETDEGAIALYEAPQPQADALLVRAMAAMKAVESTAAPIDESNGDMDVRIPSQEWRDFVDARAALMYDIAHKPASADALDAARYRYLRDVDWRYSGELDAVIRLQANALWDVKIDEAIAAQTRSQGGEA